MTMNVTETIISKLTSYCEQNNTLVVVDTGTTMEQLSLDSLALMEVVYDLEEELEMTLEPSALMSLDNVGDLIAAVNRSRQSAA